MLIQRVNRYKCGDNVRDLILKARRWIFYKGISLKDILISSMALSILIAIIAIFAFSLLSPGELVK